MLAEFFTKLQEAARESAKPAITTIEGDDRYAWLDKEKHELPPPRREHRVHSLEAMLSAAEQYGKNDPRDGSIWHNEKAVVLLCVDADRRDRVTLGLELSDQYKALQVVSKTPFQQKPFVLFLKRLMRGAIDDSLLAAVRVIEFKRRNDGSGTVQHGKESLGRSVEAEVQGMSAIPEIVVANVPVYSTPGCDQRHGIGLSIDIDPDQQTFSLTPLADELTFAIHAAQRALHEALDESGLPVFYGQP